jgi:hypothetical protein
MRLSPLFSGRTLLAALGLAFSGGAGAASPVAAATRTGGHVHAATNSALGNEIVVFDRAADGSLSRGGSYATGGLGSDPPPGAGFEQSRGGLVLGGGQGAERASHTDLLWALNAGSDTITTFRTDGQTLVRLGEPVDSGGVTPNGVTVHGALLYVLNAGIPSLGEGGLDPSITGFRIAEGGTPHRIPGSDRRLSGGPTAAAARVGFDPTGRTVTVSEPTWGIIDTFTVNPDGTLSRPGPADVGGLDPFGVAFGERHPGLPSVARSSFPVSWSRSASKDTP